MAPLSQFNNVFTPAEDQLIIKLKEGQQLGWAAIASQIPHRSPGSLQVRYSRKLSRRNKELKPPAITFEKSADLKQPTPPASPSPSLSPGLKEDTTDSEEAIASMPTPISPSKRLARNKKKKKARAAGKKSSTGKQSSATVANEVTVTQPDESGHEITRKAKGKLDPPGFRSPTLSPSDQSTVTDSEEEDVVEAPNVRRVTALSRPSSTGSSAEVRNEDFYTSNFIKTLPLAPGAQRAGEKAGLPIFSESLASDQISRPMSYTRTLPDGSTERFTANRGLPKFWESPVSNESNNRMLRPSVAPASLAKKIDEVQPETRKERLGAVAKPMFEFEGSPQVSEKSELNIAIKF